MARAVKQHEDTYPGIVREWGLFRLIVITGGFPSAYRVQMRQPAVGALAPGWVPIPGSSSPTLAKLRAKLAASCEGLAEACEGLPEDPEQACPQFWAALRAEDQARRDFDRWLETGEGPEPDQ